MATIDYKQKIKDYMNSSEVDTLYKSMLNNLFPELKESKENEMIRVIKEVILNSVPYKINILTEDTTITAEEAIAWLEKQVEQKSIDKLNQQEAMDIAVAKCFEQGEQKLGTDFSDLRTWKYIVDAVWTEKEGIGQYLDSPFTEEVAKKLQKRFGNIEQILANSAKTCKDEQKPYGQRQECVDCQFNYAGECKGSCAMKRGKQKPTEWSEEDEDYYDAIIAKLEVTQDDAALTDNQMNFLKSLKDKIQPKQEWNKEDEETLDYIIDYIEKQKSKDTIHTKRTEVLEGMIDWLKSLKDRYTWKPSEGQLECLGYAIEKAEKDWSPLTNNRIYLTLKALKEQLLELKGNKV